MASDDRTDRFRAVFEPEDIFDRFVKNANASTEVPLRRDDEPTGEVRRKKKVEPIEPPGKRPAQAKRAAPARGGPPTWDHEITVKAPSIADGETEDDPASHAAAPRPMVPPFSSETTRIAPARAIIPAAARRPVEDDEDDYDEDEELLTVPRASPLMTDSGSHILLLTKRKPLSGATAPLMHSVTVPAEPTVPPAAYRSGSAPLPLSKGPSSEDEQTAPAMELDAGGEEDATAPLDSVETMLRETRDDLPARVAPTLEAAPLSGETVTLDEFDDVTGQEEGALAPEWESVVVEQGEHTQRLEAARVVPDIEAVASRQDVTYVGEGVEAGQMPTRQLDQILSDMAVLLRYGHAGQVRERLDDLRRLYPEDLLLLRAIAEFHVEHEDHEAALEVLFVLSSALFERRNVEGMRQTLEQVLVLDPDNVRAYRLLGLLEKRSDRPPG